MKIALHFHSFLFHLICCCCCCCCCWGKAVAFPAVKRWRRGVDHLAPRLRKSRAIYLLLLWLFIASSRVKFTLYYYYYYYHNHKGINSLTWAGIAQSVLEFATG